MKNPLTGQALAAIEGYGVPACPVGVHQRIAHVHTFTEGLTAAEASSNGSKAAAEVAALFDWIQERCPPAGGTPMAKRDLADAVLFPPRKEGRTSLPLTVRV